MFNEFKKNKKIVDSSIFPGSLLYGNINSVVTLNVFDSEVILKL